MAAATSLLLANVHTLEREYIEHSNYVLPSDQLPDGFDIDAFRKELPAIIVVHEMQTLFNDMPQHALLKKYLKFLDDGNHLESFRIQNYKPIEGNFVCVYIDTTTPH